MKKREQFYVPWVQTHKWTFYSLHNLVKDKDSFLEIHALEYNAQIIAEDGLSLLVKKMLTLIL